MTINCAARCLSHVLPSDSPKERDKRFPRKVCFEQDDVSVEQDNVSKWRTSLLPFIIRRKKTFSWRKDLKLNAARCTCHHEINWRNSRDKRLLREACFGLGDVKEEKDIVTSMKRRMKTLSWRKDLKLNATRCFTGTQATVRFHPRNIRDKRLPREACFDLGDVKVEKDIVTSMKRRMKTFSWRKVLKLNAARCFTGTHATVRFTKETFVTSGCRVKRVYTWAMSKWR